jgi:hypothetical protein
MCKTSGIDYIDLVCDMPIQWNSTDKLLKAIIRMEKFLHSVLMNQDWNSLVRRNLTSSEKDWALLKEIAVFFDVFRRPTI